MLLTRRRGMRYSQCVLHFVLTLEEQIRKEWNMKSRSLGFEPLYLSCLCIVTLIPAVALGQGMMAPILEGSQQCAPLRIVSDLLNLPPEQEANLRAVGDGYNKDLEAEIAKIRTQLDAKYAAEIAKLLTDDQKAKFTALLDAEKAFQEALRKADASYQAKLMAVLYANADERQKADAARMLRYSPRDKMNLLERFCTVSTGELRSKYLELRTQQISERSKTQNVATPDWKDPKAVEEWRKAREAQTKQMESKLLEQALALMSEDETKTFNKAIEAQKAWQDAVAAAEKQYTEAATAALGQDEMAQKSIEMHRKIGLSAPRF